MISQILPYHPIKEGAKSIKSRCAIPPRGCQVRSVWDKKDLPDARGATIEASVPHHGTPRRAPGRPAGGGGGARVPSCLAPAAPKLRGERLPTRTTKTVREKGDAHICREVERGCECRNPDGFARCLLVLPVACCLVAAPRRLHVPHPDAQRGPGQRVAPALQARAMDREARAARPALMCDAWEKLPWAPPLATATAPAPAPAPPASVRWCGRQRRRGRDIRQAATQGGGVLFLIH